MNLPVKRFNFSSGVASCARPSMIPDPEGEYCIYAEAVSLIEQALELVGRAKPATAMVPRVTCGHKVSLDPAGRSSTYCMKPVGHEGECK